MLRLINTKNGEIEYDLLCEYVAVSWLDFGRSESAFSVKEVTAFCTDFGQEGHVLQVTSNHGAGDDCVAVIQELLQELASTVNLGENGPLEVTSQDCATWASDLLHCLGVSQDC